MSVATLDVSVTGWAALAGLVVAMLLVDHFAFRGEHRVSLREAAIWSVGWLALALMFGVGLMLWQDTESGSEYLAGYLLERSLSLDNIFVFAVILGYFAVPEAVQARVLEWGIAIALVLRLLFILAGAALIANFHATFYVFGAILLYTAYKLVRHTGTEVHPEQNPALRLVRKRVAMTSDYRGERVFVRENGRRIATPLLAVFVVIATTDLVFAFDSIPAIFAITQESFIVFAANAFAMLGLRALYFLVVGLMDRVAHLSEGLSLILAFIGVKMLLIDVWHPPIWLSLAVIVAVLATLALLSVRNQRRPETASLQAIPEELRR